MSYSQPPPSYSAPKGYSAIPQDEAATASTGGPASFSSPGEGDEPRRGDVADEDDFKYGVTVDQSSLEVRMQFVRKVSNNNAVAVAADC